MGYIPYKDEDDAKIVPLKVRREIIEGRVARHWDMKPWEFRELEPERAAELHVLYDLEQEIENYQVSEQRRQSKRKHDSQPKPQHPNRGR